MKNYMKISWLSFFLPFLYMLLAGFVIASELYKRIYDRGNSEMAGLGSYFVDNAFKFFNRPDCKLNFRSENW